MKTLIKFLLLIVLPALATETTEAVSISDSEQTNQVCPDKDLPRGKRVQHDYDFESQMPQSKAKPKIVQRFSSGGHNLTIVYASGDFWGENCIENVYIFEEGEPLLELKKVDAFVYHNIGPTSEFCGALITREVYDKNGRAQGIVEREFRLPDEVAQTLADLLTNDLEYENYSNIGVIETKSFQLLPPKTRVTY